MYYETGVSWRLWSFRKLHSSKESAIRDINKYKNFSNVYHSIYGYRDVENKYDLMSGNFIRVGPNYDTAVINRVVLDLDCYKKFGEKEYFVQEGQDSIFKMEDWAEKLNLEREYRFSGGGFYFIFSANGHPLKLRDFELCLINEQKVQIDPATIGDVARMMRVTNSYNFKSHRKCFCIPLTQEELFLPYEKIKKLANKQRFNERYVYGESVYDFNHHKIDNIKVELKKLQISLKDTYNADEILDEYGWSIDDLCDTIKGILSQTHVGNYLRSELIKYFKSVVKMSLEDILKLMVALLNSEGKHSAGEKQAFYIFASDYVFNPAKLKALGYCPKDCNKCMNWRLIPQKLAQLINGE